MFKLVSSYHSQTISGHDYYKWFNTYRLNEIELSMFKWLYSGDPTIPFWGEGVFTFDQKELNSIIFPKKVRRIDELLFVSPEGNLLSDVCVNREIGRKCKKTGIEKFTAHAFRDTFATRCIESGMNPKTLQEILGHADIGITMNLYCHVMDETKVVEMNNVKIVI